MTPSSWSAAARARLRHDERGFTLLETMIAITVIFGALLAFAYTATTGFRYEGFARERQGATGVATRIMEEVRGLAYEKVQQGLDTDDLASDPRIVTGCSGDAAGTYRFESCGGEAIVHTDLDPDQTVVPLMPHTGTLGPADGYPTPYTWSVYVTNDDPTEDPYRVTVVVTWESRRITGAANEVRVQSLFYSPSGCVDPATHPFAAPCQPFFFGSGRSLQEVVTISGTISGITGFEEAELLGPTTTADVQVEQVAQAQTGSYASGVSLTVSGTRQTGGLQGTTAVADGDPASETPEEASGSVTGQAGSLSAQNAGGTNVLTVSNAAGDPGSVVGVADADGNPTCPIGGPAENDGEPCASGRIQRNGASTATVRLDGLPTGLGTATLARIDAPSQPTTAFGNRVLVANEPGYLTETVTRRLGTVTIGGLPNGVSGPAGWSGYLFRLSGYQDTVSASAGTSAPAPSATVSAGTLEYWNGSGYSSLTAADLQSAGAIGFASLDHTTTVAGRSVRVVISGSASRGGASAASTGSGTTRETAQATSGPPLDAVLSYVVMVGDGVDDDGDGDAAEAEEADTVVELTFDVDLGTSEARVTYAPAPTGS
ncbi:MAG TPA: prepilin-type N-terminal cleavage/methylation domain-containing protein [Actinomycetota bacterium]|nr:prepilin-type N-terminal cleavage/methylation domain-containing protein [Actinomycetota bacterium]